MCGIAQARWHGLSRHGLARELVAREYLARPAWHVTSWHVTSWHGLARENVARRHLARHGTALHDTARHGIFTTPFASTFHLHWTLARPDGCHQRVPPTVAIYMNGLLGPWSWGSYSWETLGILLQGVSTGLNGPIRMIPTPHHKSNEPQIK